MTRIELNHKVEILIPSYTRHGGKIPDDHRNKAISFIRHELNNMFGGSMTSEAYGTCTFQDGSTGQEHISIVCSYASDEALGEWSQYLDVLCHWILIELSQESVLITRDGKATLLFAEAEQAAA